MPPRHDWDQAPTAAEARRWQLLAAGRKAIFEHGLDSFTVDDVVHLAGLAKGSFYTYFHSREQFLDALRLALAEDISDAAHQAAVGPWPGLFGRMMRASCDWLIANEPLRALFGAAYMANPERATREPLVTVLAVVLRAGAAAGVLRLPDALGTTASPEASAQMVLDLMREASARAAAGRPDDAPIAAAEEFLTRALGLDPDLAARTAYTPPD